MRGSSVRQRIPLILTSFMAFFMSSTSIQMWWRPPDLFLSRNPYVQIILYTVDYIVMIGFTTWIGDVFPSGWSNSSFVFPRLTKTVVTPCSGRFWGSLMSAPKMSLYSEADLAKSGVAMAMWLSLPNFHKASGTVVFEEKDLFKR